MKVGDKNVRDPLWESMNIVWLQGYNKYMDMYDMIDPTHELERNGFNLC